MTAAQSLARGNEIRLGMTARRRELNALPYEESLRLAADWLESPDEIIGRMRVGYFLQSIPYVGKTKAVTFLKACGLTSAALERRILLLRNHDKRVKSASDSMHSPMSLRARACLIDVLRLQADLYDRERRR